MGERICPHCIQAAGDLIRHGEALEATPMTHLLALVITARQRGVTVDDLVEGILDVDGMLAGGALPLRGPMHHDTSAHRRVYMGRGESGV